MYFLNKNQSHMKFRLEFALEKQKQSKLLKAADLYP